MLKASLRRYWPVVAATAVLLPARAAVRLRQRRRVHLVPLRPQPGRARRSWCSTSANGSRATPTSCGRCCWRAASSAGHQPGDARRASWGSPSPSAPWRCRCALSLRLRRRDAVALRTSWRRSGLAATGAFACWCTGGLETQLFTFLALLGFERAAGRDEQPARLRQRRWCSRWRRMTRPEGVLLFGLAVPVAAGCATSAASGGCCPPATSSLRLLAFLGVFVPVLRLALEATTAGPFPTPST